MIPDTDVLEALREIYAPGQTAGVDRLRLDAAGIHLTCGWGSGARPDRGDLAYHGAWDAVLLAAEFPRLPLPSGSTHQAPAMRRPRAVPPRSS